MWQPNRDQQQFQNEHNRNFTTTQTLLHLSLAFFVYSLLWFLLSSDLYCDFDYISICLPIVGNYFWTILYFNWLLNFSKKKKKKKRKWNWPSLVRLVNLRFGPKRYSTESEIENDIADQKRSTKKYHTQRDSGRLRANETKTMHTQCSSYRTQLTTMFEFFFPFHLGMFPSSFLRIGAKQPATQLWNTHSESPFFTRCSAFENVCTIFYRPPRRNTTERLGG